MAIQPQFYVRYAGSELYICGQSRHVSSHVEFEDLRERQGISMYMPIHCGQNNSALHYQWVSKGRREERRNGAWLRQFGS